MIDASQAFDVSGQTASHTPRKPSFTESAGRSAFEEALAKTRSDDPHWEAGLSVAEVPRAVAPEPTPVTPLPARAAEAERSQSVQGTRAAETSPVERNERKDEDTREAGATDDAEVEEGTEASESTTTSSEGEFALDEAEFAPAEAEAEPESAAMQASETSVDESQAASGESMGEADEESTQDAQADVQADATFELDADVQFEVSAPPSVPASQPAATSAASQTSSPAPTLVESLGRQAFARSTQLHKSASTQPASLDMDDLVDQIAKVRGSMSTGRARVVVGEGADRIALTVMLRGGTVNIDAKAADGAMAESLARGSAELAEALEKHGLSLGTMDTGGAGGQREQAERPEAPEFAAAGLASAEAEPAAPKRPRSRRGVRVVA